MSNISPDVVRRDLLRRRFRDPRFGPRLFDVLTWVETEPVISLALLPTPGGEAQADGSSTASGVHLRWAFVPELGFPEHGFVVERRLYYVDEFLRATPQAWEVLPHGTLASPLSIDRDTMRARMVGGGAPAHVVRHVDAHLDSLMQLLEQAGDIPPVGSTPVHGGGVRTDVRPLDVLLLGALDPTLARGLALYLVDGSLRAGVPADYRVTGKWGANPWPQRSVYFDGLLSQRSLAATGFFRVGWLTLFTSCACVADESETSGAFLRLTGMPEANLRLITGFAVGEIELELVSGTPAGDWQVDGAAWDGMEIGVELQRQGGSLFVRPSTVSQRFDEVTLIPPAGGTLPSTLHLTAVHVRRARGIVGDRISLVARATPLPRSTIEEESVSFPLAWPAETPLLATVRPRHTPPSLRPDGSMRVNVSQADLVCRPQRVEMTEAASHRAVRLDVGVRPLDGSGPEMRLTGSSAPSYQAVPIVHWSLQQLAAEAHAPALVARGPHAFTTNRSAFISELDLSRPALELFTREAARRSELSKPGYLESAFSATPALQQKLDDIQIEIWAAPVEGPERFPTLLGLSYKHSLWLGLTREPEGFRPRCWINGKGPYQASEVIPANSWSQVGISYNGVHLSFFVDGRLAGTNVAQHGPLQPNPRKTLCIGADPQRFGSADYPFSGFLADLRIWHYVPAPERVVAPPQDGGGLAAPVPLIDKSSDSRSFSAPVVEGRQFVEHPRYRGLRAAWPLDGQPFDAVTRREDSERGTVRYVVGHPLDPQRRALELDGNHVVEVLDRAPELYTFGDQLLVSARVFPGPVPTPALDPRDRSRSMRPTMTVLSADKETAFAFGLQAQGQGPTAAYRPTLFLAGVEHASTFLIAPHQWARVAASYDGATVRFYVDGKLEPDRPEGIEARRGSIGEAPRRIFRIGGEVDPDELTIKSAFVGRLADVEIWDRLPRHGEPLPSAEGLEPAADFAAHDLEDGRYRFWVRGVDLFGRVGPKSYADTALDSFRKPPAPTTARAGFLPVRARASSVVLPSDADPRTRISLPRTALGTLPVARTVGYDLELSRPGPINSITGAASLHTESLEILASETAGDALELSVRRSAFSLLDATADVDRPLEIPVDHEVQVEWTWTGAQRLFAPEVFAFRIAQRRRGTETWRPPDGMSEVELVDDVIARDPGVDALRAEPISHAEWLELSGNELGQRGLRWLPEPTPGADGTAVYRLLLPDTSALASSPHRLPPQDADPDTFVLGALVALDETAQPPGWQVFQVHWHEWDASHGWSLLLTRKRSAEEARVPERTDATLLLRGARFYPGHRYRARTALNTGILSEPTAAYEICVRSVSRRDTRVLESDAAAGASLVAVDRRRPPRPPVPRVTIEHANVHGRSRATVEWDVSPSGDRPAPAYLVYCAVDSAVHARDVELRRSQKGYYRGLTPEQVVADDHDFAAWIGEVFPEFASTWQSRLFVPKPESFARPGQDAEWQKARERYAEASVVWRAWSARFHSALTVEAASAGERSQLQEIAERPGMETAFSLVTSSAASTGRRRDDELDNSWEQFQRLNASPFHDEVNGVIRNAYLYRLRTQSHALVPSAEWGGVSAAAFAPKTRPPKTPALMRIESGERSITIRWALDSNVDIASYRLYRARRPEVLVDLRWWRPGPDERITDFPDPLLRVSNRSVALPHSLEVSEVLSVFRADEMGSSAFDYYSRDAVSPSESIFDGDHVVGIRRLRAIADGTPITVLIRTLSGENRTIGLLSDGGEYVDHDLLTGDDHYYRMVSIDTAGNESLGSSILSSRAFDTTPPPPPTLDAIFDSDAREVRLTWDAEPGLQHMVQRYRRGESIWRQLTDWLDPGVASWDDSALEPASHYVYRLRVRSTAGVLNRTYLTHDVEVP